MSSHAWSVISASGARRRMPAAATEMSTRSYSSSAVRASRPRRGRRGKVAGGGDRDAPPVVPVGRGPGEPFGVLEAAHVHGHGRATAARGLHGADGVRRVVWV